jgi:hypothetical protein
MKAAPDGEDLARRMWVRLPVKSLIYESAA